MSEPADPAQIVSAFAPIANEVIRLRQENWDLRWKKETIPEFAKFFENSPIEVKRGTGGRWRYSIRTADGPTSDGNYDSYLQALTAAVERVSSLFIHGRDEEEDE